MKILILGASGSGTTTLGRALAQRLRCAHLDLDDYYWMPTSPPYQQKRDAPDRLQLLRRDLDAASHAIASGSLLGWGSEVEDAFGLIVFLGVPTGIRLERLRQRETARFGRTNPEFLLWASQYDDGPPEGRSLAKHLAWLAGRRCPVLRIDGETSTEERVQQVVSAMASGDASNRLH
ncbi:AAA family ATPase [Caenimonas sedimenti]|uniref:AAA family ATPase n=1 Tax=Caenimonas sedimenti TaxID=2596921 RepID=A0A562ZUU3_9BURK|nr:AAA family ATPase [Caenimonas sedimenti]TWO72369.1 AAA family ATPase [Caenimonas sedimenti]